MLIAIKACMQSLIELGPCHRFQLFSHRLDPAFGRSKKLHTRALYPHRGLNIVHLEIILGTRDPEFEIRAIERWESHFGKLSSGIMVVFRRSIARQE
jgi:hypothetical protein